MAAMASTAEIEAAINAIEGKKETLHKSFNALLESSSASPLSFSLRWEDLDSYISSLQSTISSRFDALLQKESPNPSSSQSKIPTRQEPEVKESQNPSSSQSKIPTRQEPEVKESPNPSSSQSIFPTRQEPEVRESQNPSSSQSKIPTRQEPEVKEEGTKDDAKKDHGAEPREKKEPTTGLVARPELLALCSDMDAEGLLALPSSKTQRTKKFRSAVCKEFLPALLSAAPDPNRLILHCVESTLNMEDKDRDWETVLVLLDCLPTTLQKADDKAALEEEACGIAADWKVRILESPGEEEEEMGVGLSALGLLTLLAAFGLAPQFDVRSIMQLFVLVPRSRKTLKLCQSVGLGDCVPDLIDLLIEKGRQLDAVKFVYAFNLVETYPPVRLLKAYVDRVSEIAQDIVKKGKNSAESRNKAVWRQISAQKSVLNAVVEFHLETEYPRHVLEKQISILLKQISYLCHKASKQQQQLKKKKRKLTRMQKFKQQKQQQQQREQEKLQKMQQQSNKRPQQSTATPPPLSAPALQSSMVVNQPPVGFLGPSPYDVLPRSYGVGASGFLYDTRTYQYLAEPSVATSPGLYERMPQYNPYNPSVPPTSYPPLR